MFYFVFTISLILGVLSIWLYHRFDKNPEQKGKVIMKITKIVAILFLTFSMLNFFLPDGFARSLSLEELANRKEILQAILRWMNCVSFIVIPIAIFQKNKYFQKIAIYFCLPIALLNVVYFNWYIDEFMSPSGRGLYVVRFIKGAFKDFLLNETFRSVWFGIICFTQIISLVLILARYYKQYKFENKKEVLNFILILLGLIWSSLPIYSPQYIVGYTNLVLNRFTLVHFAWILAVVGEIIALYYIFRNKTYETKFILLLALSYALMQQFSMMYNACAELTCFKFPLQLCNLGSYIMLITLLVNKEALFKFALIINVIGATIAMIVLDVYGEGIGYLWNVHFIAEHTNVIVIPIVCLLLKIFKPLEKKDIKIVIYGFLIYFGVVFVLGTIFNGIYMHTDNSYFKCNFLFMFIKEDTVDIVGFVGPFFDIQIKLGIFTIYPVVQGFVLIVFLLLCVGTFYLIYALSREKKNKSINPQITEVSTQE